MAGSRWIQRATQATALAICLACMPPVGGASAASAGYDGVYHGQSTRTRGDDSICGRASSQVTFTVVNGQFSIVYDMTHHVGVNLQVQQDGTFSGSQMYRPGTQISQVKASGRISGNTLDAEIEGMACARSYHLTKG